MQVPLVGISLLTRLKSHKNSSAVWSKTGSISNRWAKILFVVQLNPTKELQDCIILMVPRFIHCAGKRKEDRCLIMSIEPI